MESHGFWYSMVMEWKNGFHKDWASNGSKGDGASLVGRMQKIELSMASKVFYQMVFISNLTLASMFNIDDCILR
jgi:hypothetical protein